MLPGMVASGFFGSASLAGATYWTDDDPAQTAPTGTYATKASVTVPAASQVAGMKYLVIWSIQLSAQTGVSATEARLTIDGTESGHNGQAPGTTNTNWLSGGGFAYFTAAGTPADVTCTIEHKGSGTTLTQNARVTVIPIPGAFASATSAGNTTSSFVTVATLNIPSGNDGDYILFMSCNPERTNNAAAATFRVSGAVSSDDMGVSSVDNSLFCVLPLTVSGSTTFNIDAKGDSGQSALASYANIIAVPKALFATSDSATLGTANGGTQATYQDVVTQTVNPAAGTKLVLATANFKNSGFSEASWINVIDNGGSALEANMQMANSNLYAGFIYHDVRDISASVTQTIQRKSNSTGSTTTVDKNASFLTLAIPAPASAPVFSVLPSITSASGFYAEGDTLTGVPGTHNGFTTGYKWTRDGVDIGGAISTSYTLVSADVGCVIRFVHMAINALGESAGTSSPTATIGTPTYGSLGNRKTSDGNDRLLTDGTTTRIISGRTA